MLLSTPAYFVFLVGFFFAYWMARRYRFGGLAIVLFANYFFYARWDLIYLALIPLASSCDYLVGLALGRSNKPIVRRALVTASLALNLGLILSVKYLPHLPWLLPIGLSWYAFQARARAVRTALRSAPGGLSTGALPWSIDGAGGTETANRDWNQACKIKPTMTRPTIGGRRTRTDGAAWA